MHALLDGILPFVAVAEQGSFRGAAASLGLTPAAVSKAVARLEERVGARLLLRSTRRVALSPEGALFLRHCQEAVAQVKAGRHKLQAAGALAQGEVVLSLSFLLGSAVAQHLVAWCERYPALRLRLRFEDRFSRPIAEGVDVALRMGALEDSGLVARRLAELRRVTVAAPSYLARHGRPGHPEELRQHACLFFRNTEGRLVDWRFEGFTLSGEEAALESNWGGALVEAAVAGAGLCQAFEQVLARELRQGLLVEVLEEDAAPGLPLHALYLESQRQNPRVRALVDFLVEIFQAVEAR